MNRKSLDIGNIIFGVAIIVILVSLISLNNKIAVLESEEENNDELSWEEVFSDVEMSTKADFRELEGKIEQLESKLNDLNDKLDIVENDQQEIEVLREEIDDITFFDLPSLQGSLLDIQATLLTLKEIVYSNESYRILVGKAVKKISDNEYEILLEDNTKEIIKISPECETYAVGQNAYGKIELEEYIEHLLFYEHENSTLIEVDGEIRFMFQGDVR